MLLFHPFVVLTLVFALAGIMRLRRSLAAQYVVAAVVVLLVLSYVPPIFNLILRLLNTYYGLHYIFELFYLLPVGFVLGIAISTTVDWLSARLRFSQARMQTAVAILFAGSVFVGLVEPIPLPQSPRDQLDALHQLQVVRDIQPFDQQLLTRLAQLPVTGRRVAYVTPNRIANYVVESVPNAFVTGGRKLENPSYAGNTRFFDGQRAPWLDDQDIAFLQQYDIRYLVLPADSTRIPQLALQPERFTWIDTTAGYSIFGIRQPLTLIAADRLFGQMNALLEKDNLRLWDASNRFQLDTLIANPDWFVLASAWRQEPENGLTRYGSAMAQVLSGDGDLAIWQTLGGAQPELNQIFEIHAHLLMLQNRSQAAVDLVRARFDAGTGVQRVLAARTLLSPTYFGLLGTQEQSAVIAAASEDAATWANLAEWTHEADLRQRAAVLMSAGYWQEAARWLNRIPDVKRAPSDLTAMAAIRLLLDDAAAALFMGEGVTADSILQPALEADWIEPHRSVYENDWSASGNSAARMYYTLIEPEAGDVSPTLIGEGNSLFILQTEVRQQGETLMLATTLGNFTPALPPRTLHIQVVSKDGRATYATFYEPVDIPNGTAQRFFLPIEVGGDLPADTPVRVILTLGHDRLVYSSHELQIVLS